MSPRDLPGINFFGSISGNMGLGVAARHWLRLLLDQGGPVHAVEVPDPSGRSGHDPRFASISHGLDAPAPHRVNFVALNPPCFERLEREAHPAFRTHDRVNVVLPFWELPHLPSDWLPILEKIDMAVASTRFIESAVRAAGLPVAVEHVPFPLRLEEDVPRDRSRWCVPEDARLFVSGFELASDVQRKNPEAVIEAFRRAFPREPRARLVLKLNNARMSEDFAEPVRRILALAADDPRIRILDAELPYREVLSLYACADAYVSLHRAEGLGLGLLEAMALGTPCIATRWAGSSDFTNDENAFLVGFELVPVRAEWQEAYEARRVGADARWAEPDVAEAARWMRRIAGDPALAHERGTRAAADVASRTQRASLAGFWRTLGRLVEQHGARRGSKPSGRTIDWGA